MEASSARAPTVPGPEGVVTARLLPVVAAAVVAGLLALIYRHTLAVLWTTWRTNDTYSHGPLVPLVSLALVWRDRRALAAEVRPGSARGLALIALACAMQVAGLRADLFALQGYSILALLFGLSLTFGGTRLTRRLAFPIGFLTFMLTFPPLIVNRLSFGLKEVAVRLSTSAAEALGVLLQRDGMTIYLAGGELRIEHPCSGLRSLIALLAMGTLLAGGARGGAGRRLALAAAAVPIAILANTLRLTTLLVIAHYAGVQAVSGAVHDLSGYALYALGVAALLGVRAAQAPVQPAPSPAPAEAA